MINAFVFMSGKNYDYFKLTSRQYQVLIDGLNIIKSDDFKGRVWINNGSKNKRINILNSLPEGYAYGRLKINRKATKMINNGHEVKYIEKEELAPVGWKLGGLENKSNKNKVCYSNGKINKYFEEGEAPSNFVTGRMGNSEKYIRITNGQKSKTISPEEEIPTGWRRGSHHKTNNNRKMYRDGEKFIMSDVKPDGFEKGGFRHRNITNGIINSKIPLNDKIPDGWWIGVTRNKRISITNGIENKQVCTEEEIPENWYRGCTRNFTSKTTEKLKKANKGKIYISDGVSVLQWKKEEPLPDGCFILGDGSRIWINNGVKNQKHFANVEIPEGSVKGKLPYGSRKI